MFLYQAHLLVFVTAALQILFADVDGSGEVYFVGMFRISSGFDDGMFYDKFAKVIENDPGIYFLKDEILRFRMKVQEPDRILEFPKTGLLVPAEMIKLSNDL